MTYDVLGAELPAVSGAPEERMKPSTFPWRFLDRQEEERERRQAWGTFINNSLRYSFA
jgi:hypothetical protein